jgi:hypothetical protein
MLIGRICEECAQLRAEYDRLNQAYIAALETTTAAYRAPAQSVSTVKRRLRSVAARRDGPTETGTAPAETPAMRFPLQLKLGDVTVAGGIHPAGGQRAPTLSSLIVSLSVAALALSLTFAAVIVLIAWLACLSQCAGFETGKSFRISRGV